MILHAESSAVLAWLLEESPADEVRGCLAEASVVVSSDLTELECHRALIRLGSQDLLDTQMRKRLAARLDRAIVGWTVLRMKDEVLQRGREPLPGEPLPGEPLRTIDALHLCLALMARNRAPGLLLLTLDRRLRAAAVAADFEVLPADEGIVSEARVAYGLA